MLLLSLVPSIRPTFVTAQSTTTSEGQTGPVPDEVVIRGYSDSMAILQDVTAGKLDFGYWSYPTYIIPNEWLRNLTLAQRQDLAFNLVFNPVHDRDNPYIITLDNGSKYFNPFAIREVRFALNWLINRQEIVHDILHDSGREKFSPFYEYLNHYPRELEGVISVLGLTREGHKVKALNMIDDAMNRAAQELAAQGYTLKKINGTWYFEGEPVKIVGIIRIEDERRDIGNYVADLLEDAGFVVERREVDVRTANEIVYLTDPAKYEWGYYTEGWGGGGSDYPKWSILQYYSSLAFAPGVVGWRWSPDNTDRTTVEEILKFIGNGDIEAGIEALGLEYYTTAEKISPILGWTTDEISLLLFDGYIDTDNDGNADLEIESLEQFWDLNRLGLAIGIYESNRVFIVNKIEVYPVNRNSVENYATDVNSGLSPASIITAETNDGRVEIGAYMPAGELFRSPVNPASAQSGDQNMGLLRELVFGGHPCNTSISYNVSTSEDAVVWDDINNLWVPLNTTTAPVKVTLTCRLGVWHDGQRMSLADYVTATAFDFELAYGDDGFGGFDRFSGIGFYSSTELDRVIGFEFKRLDDDNVQIVIYQEKIAPTGAPTYAQIVYTPSFFAPWQLYYALVELGDLEHVNQLDPQHAMDIKEKLGFLAETAPIPGFLEEYITPEEALERYNASINFIKQHNHSLIGDGPFYVDSYDPTNQEIVLRAFRDPRYPYTPHDYLAMYGLDTLPPTIALQIEPQTVEVGNSTRITFRTSDDHRLSAVKLIITTPDGSRVEESFDPSLGSYSYTYTVEDVGTYMVKVVATDEFGNTNEVSMEFYGKETIVETVTVNETTDNATVQEGDLELGIDVNQSAVSGETQIVINATVTTNEEEISDKNATSLALAPVVANTTEETTENETQSVAPVKYVVIDIETPSEEDGTSQNIVEKYTLKISYDEGELGTIDESTLSLYYWNGSAWIRVADYVNDQIPNGPFVYDAGVNTEENYVWAVVDHFSVYALAGVSTPALMITSPEDGDEFYTDTTENVTVTWEAEDKLGIDHYEIKLNDGPWVNVGTRTSYTFRELTEGKYTAYIKAVNIKGAESIESVTFYVTTSSSWNKPGKGRSKRFITVTFWILYKYQKEKFDELYNEALSIGIDNETLKEALENAGLAEEYYQEAMKYGSPLHTFVPQQVPLLRRAYLHMRKAVRLLEKAIEQATS